LAHLTGDLDQLQQKMAAPAFWDDQESAQKVVGQMKGLTARIKPLEELTAAGEDLQAMFDLVEEDDSAEAQAELRGQVDTIAGQVGRFELQLMLDGKNDARNAFATIHAGAESCDWAEMLLRMYLMWAEARGFATEMLEASAGDEAGIRSATVAVRGQYAYGYMQSELGVHRLVRISPFDSAKRRHTSFAAVDVVPELDETIEIEINDKDLRVDTYRASGAGGQHVNKTSSAVRITHLPTGIVVQCQNERSQHRNRHQAMKVLTARLYRLEEDKRDAELAKAYDQKGEIAWGNQIRSYVLQPYQMVKDLRTGHETGNVQAVLDGDLDPFIEAYLREKLGK
jgi:peptide chain release factor 2